jgi:hypothetical protein
MRDKNRQTKENREVELGHKAFNNYSLVVEAYSVLFHVVGLSLRDVSERYYCF